MRKSNDMNVLQIKKIFGLIILTITILITNCSTPKTDNSLSEDQFVDILARMMIIEQFKIGQTEKIVLTKELFKKFNTTKKAFTTYKNAYKNDTKQWISIYQKTEERIKSISKKSDLFSKNNLKRDMDAHRH